MFIVKHKKIFIGISVILVILSIIFLFVFKLHIGIDFKGGALLEVEYTNTRPEQNLLATDLKNNPVLEKFGVISLQPTGERSYIIKTRDLTDVEHKELLTALSSDSSNTPDINPLQEKSFNSIGPSVGRELTRKAITAIILVSLAIICFIAFSFRKVSKPVSSWYYGIIAVVTLMHDVAIPVGIFTVLSRFRGIEVDTLFVVAILTILGLSVSDTIVIFDRIRENLRIHSGSKTFDFREVVGKSLSQSYVRSICTSLTVILVLLSLIFFGPASTKYFAIMLASGMFFGTYSSIFLASPLLVMLEEWQRSKV